MKWLRENWFSLFQIFIFLIGGIVWIYSTFATAQEAEAIKTDIKERETSVRTYVDQRHGEVLNYLEKMNSTIERIDQRVYEMKRGN